MHVFGYYHVLGLVLGLVFTGDENLGTENLWRETEIKQTTHIYTNTRATVF